MRLGVEEWENWLRYLLSKNADFEFYGTDIDDKHVELIRIHKALNEPVAFQKIDYIRSGSYTKKLHEFPVFRAQLWDKLRHAQFEDVCVKIDQRYEDIIRLLQVDAYFTLLKIPQPAEKDAVVHYLNEDEIIQKQDNGLYSITNLGALLFAKDLNEFARLGRKAMRVVQYKGINRLLIQKEESFTQVQVLQTMHLFRNTILSHLSAVQTFAAEYSFSEKTVRMSFSMILILLMTASIKPAVFSRLKHFRHPPM